jgi:hypothetical protein
VEKVCCDRSSEPLATNFADNLTALVILWAQPFRIVQAAGGALA